MKPLELIFSNAKKYTSSLVITALSMMALVIVQLLVPWIIKILIQMISAQDAGIQTMRKIGVLALIVFCVYLARSVLQYLRLYQSHIAGWGVVADVRKYIYNHLQRLSLRFYHDKQVGQLMANVINDTDLFEQLIAHAIPDVIVNAGTFVGVTLVLFFLNWKLALLSMIAFDEILCAICPSRISQASKGMGRFERDTQRQSFRHPRNQGVYARAARIRARPLADRKLPQIAFEGFALDGDFSSFC